MAKRKKLLDRYDVADSLHSAAIHLLRRLRRVDDSTGLSAPKLSTLSVLVFGGPMKLGELAAAEQVRPPTMSRLIQDLESAKMVMRSSDKTDGRVVRIQATQRAKKLLKEGRSQRVTLLAKWLDELSNQELQALNEAATSIEQLGKPR